MKKSLFAIRIKKEQSSLRSFAYRFTKNSEEAKDLIQDTLVKAFLNCEKFEENTNFRAWIFTIMRNTFITNYQRVKKQNTFQDISDNSFVINSIAGHLTNEGFSNLIVEDIYKAINSIESIYKNPLLLYIRGFKYEEIAQKLELPMGTVKNRIHLARTVLKDRVK